MKFTPLGEMDLTYVGPSLDFVEYGVGGQYYAAMEGTWHSDRISGKLRLTNIAQKRSDNVNTPTLRGVMRTDDGATMFVEMNGLSQIQAGGRVFIASLILRTAHPDYQWVNTLFGVLEGELYGPPRPHEVRAHCRVYACEATITPVAEGGDRSMRAIAFVLPILSGKEKALTSYLREFESRGNEYDALRRKLGVRREAAFLQQPPAGSQIIIYREFDASASGRPGLPGAFETWLTDQMPGLQGIDPSMAGEPKVETLIRNHPPRRGELYAVALPLLANKAARLYEFASELNGIHAAEYEESLRRLNIGLTLFLQSSPQLNLVIVVVEGDEPTKALDELAASPHAFDRWHIQQMADQTGVDFSASPPAPNEHLWAWDDVAISIRSIDATRPTSS